jgi:hypothetical protein
MSQVRKMSDTGIHSEIKIFVLEMFFLFTFGEVDPTYCLTFFNATFNNISLISWQSVLLVEETRVPGECNLMLSGIIKHLLTGYSCDNEFIVALDTNFCS